MRRTTHIQCICMIAVTIMCGMSAVMLAYTLQTAHSTVLPWVRYYTLYDRATTTTKVPCGNRDCANYSLSDVEITGDTGYRIYVMKTRSYAQAVSCAVMIRNRYGILCDIMRWNSVNQKNMIPWYVLVSPRMAPDECDAIVQDIRRRGTIRYVRKYA